MDLAPSILTLPSLELLFCEFIATVIESHHSDRCCTNFAWKPSIGILLYLLRVLLTQFGTVAFRTRVCLHPHLRHP
ncbi:hypothetical protein OH492_16955 [Vibrio chagasii]|nr:hypothetical protein [Vibrio chagasii]